MSNPPAATAELPGTEQAIPTITAGLLAISGQSNAVGIGEGADLAPEDLYLLDDYAVPYSWDVVSDIGAWGNVRPRSDDAFGIELTFARDFIPTPPAGFSITKMAQTATSLGVDWDPSGTLYQRLIDHIDAALVTQGATLKAFIWIQGERDAVFEELAIAYGANLRAFAQRLWTRYGTFPFIYNRLHSGNTSPFASRVRRGQNEASYDANMHMIIVDDLELDPLSPSHFTTAGYLALGRRFADRMNGA